MKKILAIIFLVIFSLQLGIKTMVAGYFNLYAKEKARENCEYKSMTVCQGSCYVVKQIRVFSSETQSKKQHSPTIDLNSIKDAIMGEENLAVSISYHFNGCIMECRVPANLYSFEFYSDLVKPPAA